MSAPSDRFDRVIADVLADLAHPSYPDYIDNALDVATRKRQRPAWWFPERWFPMTSATRVTPLVPGLPLRRLLIVALLAVLATAIALAAIGSLRQPAPPFGLAGNGQIAYTTGGDIYTRDPIDGTVRALVSGPEEDVFPVFAPDGSTLAFFRLDPATAGTANELASVYVANHDGGALRAIVGPEAIQTMAWAPNSRELALLTTVANRDQLSIVSLDGARRTLNVDVDIDGWVEWRPPDGTELVFKGNDHGSVGFFAIGLDGSHPRRITPRTTQIPLGGGVSLTPDGSQLVYMSMGDPFDIRIADLDSGDVRIFGPNLPVPDGGAGAGPMHAGGQQLSADGKNIVFGRYWDEDLSAQVINHQVWFASLAGDGADAIPLSPVLRSQSGVGPHLVLLSPDGSQVVVHRLESRESWLTDLRDGTRREVDWGQLYEVSWQRMAP